MYRKKSKAFEMSRSILPSTARKKARDDKRALQHKNRAQIREKLVPFKGPADYVLDTYDDDYHDLNHAWSPRNTGGWDQIVFERRSADKLNHFMTWAAAVVKGMDPDDAWVHLKTLVPSGMIGDHALSHLAVEHDPNWDRWWKNYERPEHEPTPNEIIINHFNLTLREKMDDVINTTAKLQKWNKLYYTHQVADLEAKEAAEERQRAYAERFGLRHVPRKYVLYYVPWTRQNYAHRMRSINMNWRHWEDGNQANSLTKLFAAFVKVAIPTTPIEK